MKKRRGYYSRHDEDVETRYRAAAARAQKYRWSAQRTATVRHSMFGTVSVPYRSSLCALECAAEKWGTDWLMIRDAEIIPE